MKNGKPESLAEALLLIEKMKGQLSEKKWKDWKTETRNSGTAKWDSWKTGWNRKIKWTSCTQKVQGIRCKIRKDKKNKCTKPIWGSGWKWQARYKISKGKKHSVIGCFFFV